MKTVRRSSGPSTEYQSLVVRGQKHAIKSSRILPKKSQTFLSKLWRQLRSTCQVSPRIPFATCGPAAPSRSFFLHESMVTPPLSVRLKARDTFRLNITWRWMALVGAICSDSCNSIERMKSLWGFDGACTRNCTHNTNMSMATNMN